MDDTGVVCIGERRGNLARELDGGVDGQAALAREPGAQGFALDEGHGVPELSAGFTRVEDRQDVGVLQAGGDLDLAHEAIAPERG